MRDREPHHPGLDGLRGAAVAAVVGFHLRPDWFPGGWLGVSLFFTLSGFLIIGQVDRHLASRSSTDRSRDRHFALDFYRRRARRLLPAVALTLVGVMVGVWLGHPDAFDRLRGDVVAAVAYVANWRQATESGGYAAIFDATPRPLAHLWSLAVEEQVYLVVPGLMILTRRPVAVVIGSTAIGLGGLWFWWGDPDLYFATPVRALEVLAGAGLALWLNRRSDAARRGSSRIGPWVGAGAQAAAVTVMVALVVIVPDGDAITRPWLLVSIAVVVWCPLLVASLGRGRLLSLGPLRWLGERSYAIYLFHWPLIVLTPWSAPVIIVVTLALAEISHQLVEMPVRQGLAIRRAPLIRLTAVTAIVGLIAATGPGPRDVTAPVVAAEALTLATASATAPGETLGILTHLPPAPEPGSGPVSVGNPLHRPTRDLIVNSGIVPDPVPPVTAPRTVLLAGDSTAMRIEDAFRLWAEQNGIIVTTKAMPACSPLARSWEVRLGFEDRPLVERNECVPTSNEMMVDAVVFLHQGVLMFEHRLPGEDWVSLTSSEKLRQQVAAAYRSLADSTDARVLIASVPDIDLEAPTVDNAAAPVATSLIEDLAATRNDIEMLDASVIAIETDRYTRNDGVHLDPVGAAAFVLDVIAPALLGR